MTLAMATRKMHRSFLSWRQGLYGKIAGGTALLAILIYGLDRPDEPPNGGTWLGYTYGVLALVLIAWLAWFGIRRRRYPATGKLENLLSAHVYFGLALLVVGTLHTGFHFHANVHTLAYVLMVLVIGSGIFGSYAFLRYPPLMTANRGGANLAGMTGELAALDLRCRDLALSLPDATAGVVRAAVAKGGRPGAAAATLAAIGQVQQQLGSLEGARPTDVLALAQAMARRAAVLDKLQRDRRYRRLMLLWRAVHVPLTTALLVALFIHVFAVFYYL
jgi:cytochrome b561